MQNALLAVRRYFKTSDLSFLMLAIASSFYGLLLISSATNSYGNDKYIIVQGAAVAIGIMGFIVLTLFDFDHLSQVWKFVLLFNILLLSSTFFFGTGDETTGNNSWIRFSIAGMETGFQPAEFGKILFIITFAKHIELLGENIKTFKGVLTLLLHGGVCAGLVFICSNDDGMTVAFLFILVVMLFFAGVQLRYFIMGLGGICIIVPLVWNFVMAEYQKLRFLVVFDPTLALDSVGYQAYQSKNFIRAGGLLGYGLYNGPQVQYGHLPAKHTDFIFAVAGEEMGFVGCVVIIALLSAIIAKCVLASVSTRASRFSSIACAGFAAMFTFQTFVNIGMCMGVMPIIGLTLPFFSYGGTSIVTMFGALGLVASLKQHRPPELRNKLTKYE